MIMPSSKRAPTEFPFLLNQKGCPVLRIWAQPKASRRGIIGRRDDYLRIALTSPPEKSKANQELIKFLADQLGLRKAQVVLVSGQQSRRKTVRFDEVPYDEIEFKLSQLMESIDV